MPTDLIKRFSPTPLTATVTLSCASVRVATNDHVVLDRLRDASSASESDSYGAPTADWRIVVEEETPSDGEFALRGFAHDGLTFIRISHGSFLASDRQARCGISFIARDFIREKRLFEQYFFPALIAMLGEMRETA